MVNNNERNGQQQWLNVTIGEPFVKLLLAMGVMVNNDGWIVNIS